MKNLQNPFTDFINKHFTLTGNYFIPLCPSNNTYRHYGIKIHKIHILFIEDVLYLFNSQCLITSIENTQFQIYVYLRNMGYNVIRSQEDQKINLFHTFLDVQDGLKGSFDYFFIFIRHKNFNRKIENKVCNLYFRTQNELIDDFLYMDDMNVVAVMDGTAFSFLKFIRVEFLDKKLCIKDLKKKRF